MILRLLGRLAIVRGAEKDRITGRLDGCMKKTYFGVSDQEDIESGNLSILKRERVITGKLDD